MVSSRARVGRNIGTRFNDLDKRVTSADVRARAGTEDSSAKVLELENQVQLLSSSSYRGFQDSENHQKALLDPAYIGPGPARVRFLSNPSVLSTETYSWLGPWYAWGNRVVEMQNIGGTWRIMGHSPQEGFGGSVAMDVRTGWRDYALATSQNEHPPGRVRRLSSGIVILSGLLVGGTTTSGSIIAVLPENSRPDYTLIFPVIVSGNPRTVAIRATGEIVVTGTGWSAGSWVSLDGIAFPAAGVAAWTSVGAAGSGSSFANGWTGVGDPAYGPVRYWKDEWGIVWMGGLVTGGSATTDNTVMVNLPTTHRQHLQSHVLSGSADNFGFISALPGTGGVAWKNGSTSNAWVALDAVTIITSDALTALPWRTPAKLNSWVRYSPSFPELQYVRRPDGLAISQGLVGGGTVNARILSVYQDVMPEYRPILATVASTALARVDIGGYREVDANFFPGGVRHIQGSNDWHSFDGLKWAVG